MSDARRQESAGIARLSDALTLRDEIAAEHIVREVDGPSGKWALRDGQLVNAEADFFRVIGREVDGRPMLMLRQPEPALVALVVAPHEGSSAVLVNLRAEPGLRGGCQFSTTVQSTPANYERRHGGKSTPMLDIALGEVKDVRVLHDSMQYDWTQYYHRKSKRLRVLSAPHIFPVSAPLAWLDERDVAWILGQDHLATIDLHVAAVAWSIAREGQSAPGAEMPEPPAKDLLRSAYDVPLEVAGGGGASTAIRIGRRAVVWFDTTSASREVSRWIQPLLRIEDPLTIRVPLRWHAGQLEIGAAMRESDGVDDAYLVSLASVAGGHVRESVTLSAEGGRFAMHDIQCELVEDGSLIDGDWFPLGAVEQWALRSLATSVELRLGAGLARRWSDRASA